MWENLQKIITQMMKREKCEANIKIYLRGTYCAFVPNNKFVKVG
jgi:hypothetical protein